MAPRARWFFALWLALWLPAAPAGAHEVRPAYLEIAERADGSLDILWRQPVAGDRALPLRPQISAGWLSQRPTMSLREPDALTKKWHVETGHEPVEGQTVSVEGLSRSITDVLLTIRRSDGTMTTHMLTPGEPTLVVKRERGKTGFAVPAYVGQGVHHIWGGYDHLLYVLALLLLVDGWRRLLATLTAFTLAHSMTLAASVLGWVNVPAAPVEAIIALSILCVAVELLHMQRGLSGLSARFPWVVAFGFGLLHGLGFASALREVGLPPDAIPMALLLFNVGIEIGQIAFVCLVSTALLALGRMHPGTPARLRALAPYPIGIMAAFWSVERAIDAF